MQGNSSMGSQGHLLVGICGSPMEDQVSVFENFSSSLPLRTNKLVRLSLARFPKKVLSVMEKLKMIIRGGENLDVFWAEFSTLSLAVLFQSKVIAGHARDHF